MKFLRISVALVLLCFLSLFSACRKNTLAMPLQKTLKHYDVIQEALAADSMAGVKEAALKIEILVDEDTSGTLPKTLKKQAAGLAEASTIKQMRAALKPLSESLVAVLVTQPEKSGRYFEAYCPMAEAKWIQTKKELKNPYYGKSMLDCGSIKQDL